MESGWPSSDDHVTDPSSKFGHAFGLRFQRGFFSRYSGFSSSTKLDSTYWITLWKFTSHSFTQLFSSTGSQSYHFQLFSKRYFSHNFQSVSNTIIATSSCLGIYKDSKAIFIIFYSKILF